MTGAYDIATYNSPRNIKEYIEYVQTSKDPDIKGLVKIMAEEIALVRLDKGEFMGGSSAKMSDCEEDAKVLLARSLLEKVLLGVFPQDRVPNRLKELLRYKAFAIYLGTREDQLTNWLRAERLYARDCLRDLEPIETAVKNPPD